MKALVSALLFILCVSLKPSSSADKLVGTWSAIHPESGDSSTMIFCTDQTTAIIEGKDTMGGSRFYHAGFGTWCKLSYVTNYMKTPHHLDINHVNLKTGAVLNTSRCIFEFNGDKLRLGMSFDENRPVEFSPDETLLLTRIN